MHQGHNGTIRFGGRSVPVLGWSMSQPVQAPVLPEVRLFLREVAYPLLAYRFDQTDVVQFQPPFTGKFRAILPHKPDWEDRRWLRPAWVYVAPKLYEVIIRHASEMTVKVDDETCPAIAGEWQSRGGPILTIPDYMPPHLPQIIRFECDGDLAPYHDWCIDHGWDERAAQLFQPYSAVGDSRPRH